MKAYSKPNMAALHGKMGKKILEYIRSQTVSTDEDIKVRADACMARIKKMREVEKNATRK